MRGSIMMRSVSPRLITFDVTGTLLMTKLEKHYVEVGSQHGLSLDPQQLARSFNQNFRRLAIEHPIYGKHTGLGWENWWRMIVYNVFREQHRNASDITLHKIASSLIKCYSTSMCWHKYPGAIELLESLKKRGRILGVISNFDERLEQILLETSIRSYFSFVLTSYNFGTEKPDVSIFKEALRLTQLRHGIDLRPEQALHVGDTIRDDYVGAKNAKWNAVLVRHDEQPVQDERVPKDHVVRGLPELRDYLDSLFRNG